MRKRLFVLMMVIAMLLTGCLGGGGEQTKNQSPKIDSTIPAEKELEVEINGILNFSITASDPDGDSLEYMWEQTGGGSFTEKEGATAIWKAPDSEGKATVKITVSDGKSGTDSHTWEIEIKGGQSDDDETLYPTPAGYNHHDYQKLVDFLEVKDSDGVENGKKLNDDYIPEDPITWNGIEWSGDAEKRIVRIDIENQNMEIRLQSELDVSGLECLEELYCYGHRLSSLDVTGCTALTKMNCANNALVSLNVKGLTNLEELGCAYNQLSRLDVTGLESLKALSGFENQIDSIINLPDCNNLEFVAVSSNRIVELDFTGLKKLEQLSCNNNSLTSLKLQGCMALERLLCFENDLVLLDVSDCENLQELICDSGVELIGWPK